MKLETKKKQEQVRRNLMILEVKIMLHKCAW